ncbi:MAG: sugar ABC transporter permease [Oscillospiraceae bacterium]|nr:sugar ABC transporter permease [Oscillospiraceae bacterium]
MEKKVIGTVVSVKKQWWLKVNTKPIRMNTLDGATFPHIIKVSYVVNGTGYFKRKWIRACDQPPAVGTQVTILYDESKPSKSKVLSI